jgi:sec-independent protein translocase protein TatB
MFDIAWSELLLIAVVALIFIGPKELPHVLANLGRAATKLRRSADEFRRHFEDSMRESGYEDLHKNLKDFKALNPTNQLRETIDRAIYHTESTGPFEPAPHTTPEAAVGGTAQVAANVSESAQGEANGVTANEPVVANGLDALENAVKPEAAKPPVEAAKDHAAPLG